MRSEIKEIGDAVIRTHDGQMMFNIGEVSKILGCGASTVPMILRNAGIEVKKVGMSKKISAYDIAEIMCVGRIAVIDNTSRSCAYREPKF